MDSLIIMCGVEMEDRFLAFDVVVGVKPIYHDRFRIDYWRISFIASSSRLWGATSKSMYATIGG